MTIEISEEGGVRFLHFGTPWVQGAMRIARPWALELQYTRDMLLPLLLEPLPWPARVLMVGLGSASLAKFLWRYWPQASLVAVELDSQVIAAAHHHFRLPPPDHRLQIVQADGYDWMQTDPQHYDLILLDAFDRNARAHRLESTEFYAACRDRLAPGGWITCNLLTLHRSHAATRRALTAVFGQDWRLLPPCAEGNVVAIAQAQALPAFDLPALREAATILRQATHLNLLPLLSRIERN